MKKPTAAPKKKATRGKPGPKPKAKTRKVPRAVAAKPAGARKQKAKEAGKVKVAMATLKRLNPKAWGKPRAAGKAKRKARVQVDAGSATSETVGAGAQIGVHPALPRPTVIKKVIQGADSQALKILVENVKRNFLEAERAFENKLPKWPAPIQERARQLIAHLGATPATAGNLAIRVAELEHERNAPKKSRKGRSVAVAVEDIGKDEMAVIDMDAGVMRKDHGDAESALAQELADEGAGLVASA